MQSVQQKEGHGSLQAARLMTARQKTNLHPVTWGPCLRSLHRLGRHRPSRQCRIRGLYWRIDSRRLQGHTGSLTDKEERLDFIFFRRPQDLCHILNSKAAETNKSQRRSTSANYKRIKIMSQRQIHPPLNLIIGAVPAAIIHTY